MLIDTPGAHSRVQACSAFLQFGVDYFAFWTCGCSLFLCFLSWVYRHGSLMAASCLLPSQDARMWLKGTRTQPLFGNPSSLRLQPGDAQVSKGSPLVYPGTIACGCALCFLQTHNPGVVIWDSCLYQCCLSCCGVLLTPILGYLTPDVLL